MAQGRVLWAVLLLLVLVCSITVEGVELRVGGASGWSKPNGNTLPATYLQDWAQTQSFQQGDRLRKLLQTCSMPLLEQCNLPRSRTFDITFGSEPESLLCSFRVQSSGAQCAGGVIGGLRDLQHPFPDRQVHFREG